MAIPAGLVVHAAGINLHEPHPPLHQPPGDQALPADVRRRVELLQDIERRATIFLQRSLAHGVTRIRTHTDVGEVTVHDVDQTISTPDGPKRVASRLAFIWIGDLQYELIQVVADETGIYANCQSNGGPLRFHHICMKVDDWDSFRAKVDQQSLPLVMERASDDKLKFLYLDARATLGHYLEYIFPEPGGIDFFENVPGQ